MADFDSNTFWDTYTNDGVEEAMNYVRGFISDERDVNAVMQDNIPELIGVAKEREINMIEFLANLDELEQKQLEEANASGTDNDARELHPDSGDETDESQDEDESAPAPDADGEDRGEDEGSTGS